MDRISYNDGYRKGIMMVLKYLKNEDVIDFAEVSEIYKVMLQNNLTVPEEPEYYRNKDYIGELKRIHASKNYYKKILPSIKEIEDNQIYREYGYSDIREILIYGVGLPSSSVSELLKIKNSCLVNEKGNILPKYDHLSTKVLVCLSNQDKKDVMRMNFPKGITVDQVEDYFNSCKDNNHTK